MKAVRVKHGRAANQSFSGAPVQKFAFLLLATATFLLARTTPANSTLEQCQKLYIHEYTLLTQSDLMLASVIQMAGQSESTAASATNSIEKCTQRSTAEVQCRLKANHLIELLQCSKNAPATEKKGEIKQIESPMKTSETKKPAVEKASCEKAYKSMLTAVAQSDLFKERADRQKLIGYWQSESARNRFIDRCQNAFEPEDIQCLENAKTHSEVQKCLTTIPAGR